MVHSVRQRVIFTGSSNTDNNIDGSLLYECHQRRPRNGEDERLSRRLERIGTLLKAVGIWWIEGSYRIRLNIKQLKPATQTYSEGQTGARWNRKMDRTSSCSSECWQTAKKCHRSAPLLTQSNVYSIFIDMSWNAQKNIYAIKLPRNVPSLWARYKQNYW